MSIFINFDVISNKIVLKVPGRDSPSSSITVFSTSIAFLWKVSVKDKDSRDLMLVNLTPK